MNRFVYVIFDMFTAEIFSVFDSESECADHYDIHYKGFINVNWMGVNLSYVLKNFYHIGG